MCALISCMTRDESVVFCYDMQQLSFDLGDTILMIRSTFPSILGKRGQTKNKTTNKTPEFKGIKIGPAVQKLA